MHSEELANIVAQRVQHSLQGVYLIGTPVQIEGNWIVPRYPYRAPPHYVQAGYVCLLSRTWTPCADALQVDDHR